jgi:hypothetical protein
MPYCDRAPGSQGRVRALSPVRATAQLLGSEAAAQKMPVGVPDDPGFGSLSGVGGRAARRGSNGWGDRWSPR